MSTPIKSRYMALTLLFFHPILTICALPTINNTLSNFPRELESASPGRSSSNRIQGRDEEEGQYGYIEVWLDAWTVLQMKSHGDDWLTSNNDPEARTHTIWNKKRDKEYEDTLYLLSYDPPTGTDFYWWMKKPKKRDQLKVKMSPTKEGEDRRLIEVKIRAPGAKNEASMHGGSDLDVVAEWVKIDQWIG